ncbi:MAG: hypothetical protein IME93_04680 [Proteobacteria bacterium]|nr:hypothetical protein [Pseudomonadota bacterium]
MILEYTRNVLWQRVSMFFLFISTVMVTFPVMANMGDGASSVQVWQENLPDKVVYHYRVRVIAEGSVATRLKVGFDYFHGIPLLRTRPISIRAPRGWVGEVMHTEETLEFEIDWKITGAEHGIKAGQTLDGFAVEVPVTDNRYRSTFFTVYFGLGPHLITSMRLEAISAPPPGDTLPPTLSVTVSPDTIWPPNHKMVDVAATVTVQDDQDANPVVKLVSIVCNECDVTEDDVDGAVFGTDDRNFAVRAERTGQRKEGRVYTVIYSATDVAGNSATTEATVTIPHDQRK